MEIFGIFHKDNVKEIALKFSKDNNIVTALHEDGKRKGKKVWANEKDENGLNGGFVKNKISCLNEDGKIIWIDYTEFKKRGLTHFNKDRDKTLEERKLISIRTSGKNNPMFGKKHIKESIDLMSKNRKGFEAWNKGITGVYSEETLKKMRVSKSEEHKEKLRGPKSEEHKQALRENQYDKYGENNPMFGKKQSDETKRKISEKNKNQPKIKYPYCEKEGTKGNMKRWHFDNCKLKKRKEKNGL